MKESREKTPASTLEKQTIKKGKPFTFFPNQAERTSDTLSDSRQVEGIGTLSGTAKKLAITPSRWGIVFSLSLPEPKPKERIDTDVKGEPGENLVMFASLPNGQNWGSLGVVSKEDQGRQLVFNQWIAIDTQDKIRLIGRSEKRIGNPLPIDDADLDHIQYKLV